MSVKVSLYTVFALSEPASSPPLLCRPSRRKYRFAHHPPLQVNPVPIELTLRGESPYIADAVVFGGERAQIGALLVLSEAAPSTTTREEILSLIRPTLALANSASPSHAQLSSELLLILPAGTAIPKADKGSFIRRKVYAEFKAQIDGVYSALEGDSVDEADKKDVGSLEDMETTLFELVKSVAGGDEGLTKDTDLFSYGLDSLAAGRIRNALQRASAPSSTFGASTNSLCASRIAGLPPRR